MLNDQQAREQFQNISSENFSVIASPGAGKTTAITRRITNIICSCNRPENLKTFLAVTYTEKAADEIKERVTNQVLDKIEKHSAPHYSTIGLNNIFFGTIHSLCANLLRKYGSLLSIKKDFEIIENDSKLWKTFTQNYIFLEGLSDLEMQILPYFSIDKILDDAHTAQPHDYQISGLRLPDEGSIQNLLKYSPNNRENKIKEFQNDLQTWEQLGRNCPIPEIPKTSSKIFAEFLSQNAHNFMSWQEKAYEHFVNVCANRYQQFRVLNDILTYDDLINLTLKLLTKKDFDRGNYQIILDEAQDTDPNQFKILIALANKKCYEKIFENKNINLSSSEFSFSMVGDPKQAIYSNRADVNLYIFLHNKLSQIHLLKPLSFNITMRCSKKIVSFVNKNFPHTFLQFSSENMQAHPDAEQGSVEIIKTENNLEKLFKILEKIFTSDGKIVKHSDVAILSPRKAWLEEIIVESGRFPASPKFQLWANKNIADQPSLMKWTTAILHYLFSPTDKVELASILREIFGIPTNEVVAYINHDIKNICYRIEEKISKLRTKIYKLYLPNVLRNIIEEFQLIERIDILNIYPKEKIAEQYNILMNIAYEIDANNLGYRALEEKLSQSYQCAQNDTIVDENAVQLLTYHKSKGLEWPIVILPFLYREHKLTISCQSEIENEERMLFVACTRAKQQLTLLDDSAYYTNTGRSNMISSGKILDGIL